MALMVLFDVDGMTEAQYDDVIATLAAAGAAAPQGRLTHVAGPRPGGWMVVDTYESEEAFGRFGQQLLPVLAAQGIRAEPRVMPAHSLVVAPAALPA